MINRKNIYTLENTKNFFNEFPIILIYQHNNLTVKQHITLKTQLQKFENIKTLTIKNSIVEKIKKDKIILDKLENLLQGPLFFIGCHTMEEVQNIWNILNTIPGFLFVGSQFNKQIYTHLDIKKSLQLNKSIYIDFLNIISNTLNFENNIRYPNLLQDNTIYNNVFFILDQYSYTKK